MLNKIFIILQKIEESFLILLLAVMTITLFSQVLFRYAFKSPLLFSEELSRYLQVWILFAGIGYAMRMKSHISMEYVKSRLPAIWKSIVLILTQLLNLYCMCYFYAGAKEYMIDQEGIPSSAMLLPMDYVYMIIPVGAVITIIYLIASIINEAKSIYNIRNN